MEKARGCNRTVLRQIVLASTDTVVNLLLSMVVREIHTEKKMLVLYECLILILVCIAFKANLSSYCLHNKYGPYTTTYPVPYKAR